MAKILSLTVEEQDPLIAVIRCNGSPANSSRKVSYEGATSCAFAHNLFSGEGGCPHSCLGLGDCVRACAFDAIHMNPESHLPVVNDKCVACGACVEACPRDIIELRPKGKKDRRIFVSCINQEKGGPAKRNCDVACIGCSKCFNVCKFDAITMANNLAYIDPFKCVLCRKCEPECPTNAIHEINLPERKQRPNISAVEKKPETKPVDPKAPVATDVVKIESTSKQAEKDDKTSEKE
ncbi:MAG: 4Fe-4S binding protein [Bacteroidales bacterium]